MKALQYLRHLQSDFPTINYPQREDLRVKRAGVEGYTNNPEAMTLEQIENALWRTVVEPFFRAIDANASVFPLFGLLPTNDPNAWTLRTDSGEHLVALHTGLWGAIHWWSELTVSTMHLARKMGDVDAALRLETLGYQILVSRFSGVDTRSDYPVIPVQLSPEDTIFVLRWEIAQLCFIFAHELAHSTLGHTAKSTVGTLSRPGMRRSVERLDWRQQQEFEADVQAMRWILVNREPLRDLARRSDIFLFLAIAPWTAIDALRFIHYIEQALGAPGPDSSHPAADSRLKNVDAECSHLFDADDRNQVHRMIRMLSAPNRRWE